VEVPGPPSAIHCVFESPHPQSARHAATQDADDARSRTPPLGRCTRRGRAREKPELPVRSMG
jgi:hypothetical protein